MGQGDGGYTVNINLDKAESTLAENISWIEYLTSTDYTDDLKARYENKSNRKKLEKEASRVIEEEIYAKGESEHSTGGIRRSIKVVSSGKIPTLIVVSDPEEAPAKSGKVAGIYSYLAFFEDVRFLSFLPPDDDPYDVKKHRPFMRQLADSIQSASGRISLDAIMKTIKARMPRKGN